ncbi:hypothetical protein BJ508DRAFT_330059 [Ascobolus immersus RN42]|uniref:Uncharacterized protein n=1 Tax=Ascobolus immersus RN42 TaxID=1160509 RepID=A0A3N4HUQ3_ASCIM|nr:hypothetical protein BJ508DRAFT_330059 [Ascobolus immersus RN42]
MPELRDMVDCASKMLKKRYLALRGQKYYSRSASYRQLHDTLEELKEAKDRNRTEDGLFWEDYDEIQTIRKVRIFVFREQRWRRGIRCWLRNTTLAHIERTRAMDFNDLDFVLDEQDCRKEFLIKEDSLDLDSGGSGMPSNALLDLRTSQKWLAPLTMDSLYEPAIVNESTPAPV